MTFLVFYSTAARTRIISVWLEDYAGYSIRGSAFHDIRRLTALTKLIGHEPQYWDENEILAVARAICRRSRIEYDLFNVQMPNPNHGGLSHKLPQPMVRHFQALGRQPTRLLGMPDQYFVEEPETFDGGSKTLLSPCCVQCRSINMLQVISECIVNRKYCIDRFNHKLTYVCSIKYLCHRQLFKRY